MSPQICPASMSKESRSSATIPPNRTVTSLTSSNGMSSPPGWSRDHSHLRVRGHADPLGDLALAQPSVEAQLDDRALALGQRREQLADHQPVVRAREQLIVDTQREALAVSAVVVVRRRDEWGGPIRTARFECFEDVVDPDAEMLGEL